MERLPLPQTDVRSVSLFYLIGLFDLWTGIRTILISSVGAYMIAFYFQGPFMPWIGFVFVMGHMSINHIYRQFANTPDKVDITGKLRSKLVRDHGAAETHPFQERRWCS